MLPDHYSEEEAAVQLEAAIRKEESETEEQANNPQLTTANISDYFLSEFQVMEYEEPKCWKLSMVNKLTGDFSPVRMRVQGIISEVDFPPVCKPSNINSMERMRPHLRQGVKLTGLYSDAFAKNVEQLELIQVMFSNALPAGSLKDWSPSYEGNNLVIDMHNRFFTKKANAPNCEKVSFQNFVDPNGVLDAMQRDGKFIHTQDNRVYYFGPESPTKSEPSPANPTLFRSGDLVDVSVEFAAFPSGVHEHTTVVVLRGIRLLSSDLRNKAAILAMRSRYRPMPKLKRKSTEGPGEACKAEDPNKRLKQRPDADNTLGQSFASTQVSNINNDLHDAQELFVRMQVSDPTVDP